MILEIKKDSYITEDFIRFITKLLKRIVLSNVDTINKERFNEELKLLGINRPVDYIVYLGVSNIKSTDNGDSYTIYIDHNKKVDDTNYKIESICKLIDKGNSTIKPTKIFSDSMDYIKSNIKKFFDMYCLMGV